jgi:ATP-dependent Lon protease
MPTFDELSFRADCFSGQVRLFPLPNFVLFPHVMQPLHVFEPRYRDLVEAAIQGDRLIAMAVLGPGWETEYEGRPALYPAACLGRITAHVRLADGAYNILVLGLRRLRLLRELEPARRFREAEAALCGDAYPPGRLARRRALKREFREALERFLPLHPAAQEQLDQLLDDSVPLGTLTDVIGFMLDLEVAQKCRLLSEADVYRRAELLLAHLAVQTPSAIVPAVPCPFPPVFSTN